MSRKLVTIRKISNITPIEGADAIEVAAIDGWKVVVKKNEFQINDLVLYFEIDSWIPHELAPFLSKGQEPRVYEGIRGQRLRTIKLRGQISQGLILPLSPELLSKFATYGNVANRSYPVWHETVTEEGYYIEPVNADWLRDIDLSASLGIVKWEAEIPASLAGQVKGPFPSFIRKTDQERCQNLYDEIFVQHAGAKYEVTTKLDGSSCTIYFNRGELGVCSRNLELKINDENKDNTLVKALFETQLNVGLPAIGRNVAIQGEIMGPGIQGNRENLKMHQLFIFDIYDIDRGEYFTPAERQEFVEKLRSNWCPQLKHVPVICHSVNLYDSLGINNIDDLLNFAEGPSLNHTVREGVVFKSIDGKFSFKAISNTFLSKEK